MNPNYDEWNDFVWPKLMERVKADVDYQALLAQCETLTPGYQLLLSRLSPEQQEQLERYISCCEEMEYRLAQLAYQVGKAKMPQRKTDEAG